MIDVWKAARGMSMLISGYLNVIKRIYFVVCVSVLALLAC